DEPESLKYIERALSDEDIQMRLGALRALALRSPERSAPLFIKQMQAGDFMQRESRERITIATALGETKSPAALTYLSGVFTQKSSIFGRGKVNEMKILAVTGLAAMRSLEAFHVLAQEVQNRNHSMEVLQACRKAALRLKEILEKERV
ncbi:MAG: HEAT repeat domain-containing protein, partial [Myxococcota bacterium]